MNENTALSTVSSTEVATRFAQHDRLSVRQRKNWIEILLAFETRNQYDVLGGMGGAVMHVQEVGEGAMAFLARMLLGPWRPFTVHVKDTLRSDIVLRLERPWRWWFHRLEVYSGSGEMIGAIEREWSWFRRVFRIEAANKRPLAEVFGPFLKPWTFEIKVGGQEMGKISKKWSGLGKEMFSDADNFGVEMGRIEDPKLRALVFAATVLVDIVHFERSKNS